MVHLVHGAELERAVLPLCDDEKLLIDYAVSSECTEHVTTSSITKRKQIAHYSFSHTVLQICGTCLLFKNVAVVYYEFSSKKR
jgi:hypothetical protein